MATTTTRWLTPAEMRAWRAFVIGSTRLQEAFDRDLVDHGLSMADYEVLAHLSEAPGRQLRMSELADISLISRSRLSHRMKVLEAAGWVTRQVCTEDRRGSFAVMREEGWRKIVAAAPDHVASVRRHLIDVLTPEELEVIAGAFERVVAGLRSSSDVCSN
jgi:DNA-binding MarR family transcriptional regulator